MNQDWVIPPVENRDQRRANDILGDIIKRFLVPWYTELLHYKLSF